MELKSWLALLALGCCAGALLGQELATPKYGRREPLSLRALEARKQTLDADVEGLLKRRGQESLVEAVKLNNLALVCQQLGDYARAEKLLLQAVDAYARRGRPGKSRDRAVTFQNLGVLYHETGDYAKAEAAFRQALDLLPEAKGPAAATRANFLSDLAALHAEMGDYPRAEELYRDALALGKEALGERHPDYAAALHNLGLLYEKLGQYDRAEPLLLQDLGITRAARGPKRPEYAHSLESLAFLYRRMGKTDKAEPLYREALQVYRATLGKEHPSYARTLNNLGFLTLQTDGPEKARPLLERALELRREALGPDHVYTADSLGDLAALHVAAGDFRQAEELLRDALRIMNRHLELTATVQSERQQLAAASAYRGYLDAYLTLAARSKQDAEKLYQHALAWKGAVFARQRCVRAARDNPDLAPHFEELRAVTSQLAALSFVAPAPKERAAWEQQIKELAANKERIEQRLAPARGVKGDTARRVPAPAELARLLPEGAVLVDFLEYRHGPINSGDGKRHLAAFVLRPGKPVTFHDLGPAEPIRAAIEQWRAGIKRHPDDAGTRLRKLLWEPLEPKLEGAKLVLTAPDGLLAAFPFAALPGREPGRYLIEDVPVAVVSVPRLLPELLTAEEKTLERPKEPTLLVVGDVDFGAESSPADAGGASRAAPRGGARRLGGWKALPATRGEALAVRDSFEQRYPDGQVRVLRGPQATEAALRQQAPRHRWLHLATHGFFAPAPDVATAAGRGDAALSAPDVTELHPGLLSGLVLAGANRPTEPARDDGILTALEVAELDLRGVEVVVLSACETGLGKETAGEGLLGLQRALQVSGARTVVTSLWSVDDEATRKLMERFYENLWQKKMGKLEALRDAQLWMLREGAARGIARLDEASGRQPTHLPPFFWAGFVLSGDWR